MLTEFQRWQYHACIVFITLIVNAYCYFIDDRYKRITMCLPLKIWKFKIDVMWNLKVTWKPKINFLTVARYKKSNWEILTIFGSYLYTIYEMQTFCCFAMRQYHRELSNLGCAGSFLKALLNLFPNSTLTYITSLLHFNGGREQYSTGLAAIENKRRNGAIEVWH